jgi:hypothetical protein
VKLGKSTLLLAEELFPFLLVLNHLESYELAAEVLEVTEDGTACLVAQLGAAVAAVVVE